MVCKDCDGRCCRKFVVFITARDALRIKKAVPQLDLTYFLNYYPAEIESPHPKFLIKNREYILGLDSKSNGLKDCVFLVNVGNTKICGIHKHRPLPCRTYPFTLKSGKLHSIEDFLCPRQWWPEAQEKKHYIRDINQFRNELEDYNKLVNIWNRNFGKEGSFIEFLNFIIKQVKM